MYIRASMLPRYSDCSRLAVARQYRKMITEAGYELRSTLPTIGAAVGTATHAVAESYFKARMAGVKFNLDSATDEAMVNLQEEVATGAIWDDSTPRLDVARKQVQRMASIYIDEIGKFITPLAFEIRINADLGDGWILTGQIDLIAAHSKDAIGLGDLKTGGLVRSYHAQLGAYSLLYRTAPPEGLPPNVGKAWIDFIQRAPLSRQASIASVTTPYPVPLCERTAWAAIQRIKRDVTEFQQTGNPDAFPENPMSMLCNATYCIAFATDFCPITKSL